MRGRVDSASSSEGERGKNQLQGNKGRGEKPPSRILRRQMPRGKGRAEEKSKAFHNLKEGNCPSWKREGNEEELLRFKLVRGKRGERGDGELKSL